MEYYNGLLAKAKETYDKINQYAGGSGNGNSSGTKNPNNPGGSSHTFNKYYLGETRLNASSQEEAVAKAIRMIKDDIGYEPSKKEVNKYIDNLGIEPLYVSHNVEDDSVYFSKGRVYYNEPFDITKKYKNGGYVNYTGPAWVDGSPGSPEAFLNSSQTRMFENLTLAIQKMYNNNGYQGFNGNVSIENITIKTDELNSSQDFAKAGNALASSLQEALRQRGIITNLKR